MHRVKGSLGILFPLSILVLTCPLGACTAPDGPFLHSQGRPIVYGQPDDNPAHMATVAITFGPGSQFFCSGSLITNSVVMTAAHCLEVGNPTSFQVYFGDTANVSGSGVYRQVQEGLIHPDYDRDAILNDIGLLRLASPAPAAITPIPHLPAALGLTAADEGVTTVDFSGFGQTETGSAGVKLHVSDVIDVVCDGPATCQGYVNPLAMGYDQDPGGPCSGDSGGPAYVLRDGVEYVAGVTSYGDRNCAQYGVSTMADRFAPWIESFIIPEICGNGVDDDDDGLIDCDDSECASDPTCPDACVGAASIGCGETTSGTTLGGAWAFTQYSCLQDGYEAGPEVAFLLDVPAGTAVTADLFPSLGGDLDFFAVQTTAGACDLGRCLSGSFEYNSPERLAFNMPAEPVYLVVDTWDNPTSFDLQISCGATEDCLNAIDDDADGLVDCLDPDCNLHPQCQPDACQAATQVGCGAVIDADTNDGVARFSGYGCLNQGTEDGPELGFVLDIPAGTSVSAVLTHASGSDLDLFLLPLAADSCDTGTCLGSSLEYQPPEQIDFVMPADGAALVVETFQIASAFQLTISCDGQVAEICDNDLDDDGDGLADCEDPDCAQAANCQAQAEICDNDLDDDDDGLADCGDPDCAQAANCQAQAEICDNDLDDDGDGLADCEDPDCAQAANCQAQAEICDNGQDDDGDGAADCDDADCAQAANCQAQAEICDNGQDDDGDLAIDCADADCADALVCQSPTEDCQNGLDDDGDGLVDCADPDCDGAALCQDDDKPKPGGCAQAGGGAGAGFLWIGLGLLIGARRLRRRR